MPWWMGVLAGAPLVLLAAKVHGRALRLEREAMGVHEVEFRDPPPLVAAIWRRDRVRFWLTLPALALALPALGALAGASWATALLLALVAAPTLAFAALGLDSQLRRAQPPGTARASVAWWGALALGLGAWLALVAWA